MVADLLSSGIHDAIDYLSDAILGLGKKGGGGWIDNILGSIFPSANGNVFSSGSHVTAYANGGVVNGPTLFPMNGGKTGLMGEAGPEAIMPLTRIGGKLGVRAAGGEYGASSTTRVLLELSPQLIAEVLEKSANNTVDIIQDYDSEQASAFGGRVNAVTSSSDPRVR